MSRVLFAIAGCTLFIAAVSASTPERRPEAAAAPADVRADRKPDNDESLAAKVREVTAIYQDINQAIYAGYKQFGGCVSGPEVGAMGVHFVNGGYVDGYLDVNQPEALIYEIKNNVARLLGVEYITPVPAWDAAHDELPVLAGQHLQFVGTPNRYRLPALYELHVWAWRNNPNGTFVDWNPKVSCDGAE